MINLRLLTFAKNIIEKIVKERILFKNYKERFEHLKSITSCLGVSRKVEAWRKTPALLSNNLWIAVSSIIVGSGAKPLTILVHILEAFGAIKICM